jgi:Xaa-Pro dipeptidase
MQQAGIQAVALNPSPNLIYLTGLHYHLMERPIVIIIPDAGELVAILPEFEVGKLKGSSLNFKPFAYAENPAEWPNVFSNACQYLQLDSQKIGVDPLHMRFLEYQYLQAALPQSKFVDAGEQISMLRVRKDAHEISLMRQAVVIAEKAFQNTLGIIHPGISERELAQELSVQMLRAGGDNDSEFGVIVASGPNSANPHHTPSDRKLQTGEPIIIDWGAKYKGYYSDLTRTVFLGSPSPHFLEVYNAVLKANTTGRAAGRPGIPAGQIDQTTRKVIESLGYGEYFTHRTGHGLGMEVHEPAYIFAENRQELEIGMVYTIEPGIYLPGKFGVRIEDDVVVIPDGVQDLSDYSHDLIIL